MMGFFLLLMRLDGQVVHLSDQYRIGENVTKDVLAITNFVLIPQNLQHRLAYNLAQIFVALRHDVEQDVQFQILNQRFAVWRQRRLQIEVTIPVHEKGLHDLIRSRICRRVRRYFSAIDIAYASPSAGFRTIL